jgi:sporulation-control protein spo0M
VSSQSSGSQVKDSLKKPQATRDSGLQLFSCFSAAAHGSLRNELRLLMTCFLSPAFMTVADSETQESDFTASFAVNCPLEVSNVKATTVKNVVGDNQ